MVAIVLAGSALTALAGIASAVTLGPAAAPAPAAPSPVIHVLAVDEVQPQPIELTFAAPVTPAATRAVAPRTPAARPAPAPKPRAVRVSRVSNDCTGAGWQQRRGAKALASLRFPVPAGVTIAFLPGRGALKGLTYYDRRHVDVFVGSCAQESDSLLRHVVAHELGHAWDATHMTAELRADYLAARGIPAGTPWFGCSYCKDFATPAGDFAETYAQWQRGTATSRSEMARPATAAELTELAQRFFR